MTLDDIGPLEAEWELDTGFFWKLRQGEFEQTDFRRALAVVGALKLSEGGVLPRRVVSLLWYIRIFMVWQEARLIESGHDLQAYQAAASQLTEEIERLLGIP